MYKRQITERLIIQNAERHHAYEMACLQRRVFPTLSSNELLSELHFDRHIRVFPQGQFVVLLDGAVIASTSTFLTPFPDARHTFLDITGDLWLTTHDPKGEWMYGFDMGVDPELQGLGLGRLLYRARGEMAQKLSLQGQVIVGMPSGYGKVSAEVPFNTYYQRILSGDLFDPTVSMQMKMGFKPVEIIEEYLQDPKCGNYGVMMTLPSSHEIADPSTPVHVLHERIESAAQRINARGNLQDYASASNAA